MHGRITVKNPGKYHETRFFDTQGRCKSENFSDDLTGSSGRTDPSRGCDGAVRAEIWLCFISRTYIRMIYIYRTLLVLRWFVAGLFLDTSRGSRPLVHLHSTPKPTVSNFQKKKKKNLLFVERLKCHLNALMRACMYGDRCEGSG